MTVYYSISWDFLWQQPSNTTERKQNKVQRYKQCELFVTTIKSWFLAYYHQSALIITWLEQFTADHIGKVYALLYWYIMVIRMVMPEQPKVMLQVQRSCLFMCCRADDMVTVGTDSESFQKHSRKSVVIISVCNPSQPNQAIPRDRSFNMTKNDMIDIGFSTGSSENTASYFIMDICLLRKLARRESLVSCYKNALLYPVRLLWSSVKWAYWLTP